MKFRAAIYISPRPEILDPQGKATQLGLHNMGFEAISDVRIGKMVHLEVEADDASAASDQVEAACRKLLANPIIEQFRFELSPA